MSSTYSFASPKPREARKRYSGFMAWMDASRDAVYELLYAGGVPALGCLRRIAFGEYDWYQSRAVLVLCRLASEGIQTDEITTDIVRAVETWEWETVCGSLPGLSLLAIHSSELAQKLLQLSDDWAQDEPIEQLEVLEPLSIHVPEVARERVDALYRLMREQGKGMARSELADGHTVVVGNEIQAQSGRAYPRVPDLHAIRAGLVLRRLRPEDSEVEGILRDWAENHPDPRIQRELNEILD